MRLEIRNIRTSLIEMAFVDIFTRFFLFSLDPFIPFFVIRISGLLLALNMTGIKNKRHTCIHFMTQFSEKGSRRWIDSSVDDCYRVSANWGLRCSRRVSGAHTCGIGPFSLCTGLGRYRVLSRLSATDRTSSLHEPVENILSPSLGSAKCLMTSLKAHRLRCFFVFFGSYRIK